MTTSPFDFDRPELHIPAWVKGRWPKFLQGALFSVAFVTAWLVGLSATRSALESYAIVMLVYFTSVIAHEIGHWLGAVATGRRVIGAQLSWIALWRLRRGWRVRLSRPRHAAGWVLAVAAEGEVSRAATAIFIAGGAFANAVLVAVGLLWREFAMPGDWVWFALVAINLAMMLVSLIPHAAQYFTDGLHLVAVAKGKRSAKTDDLLQHIVAHAVAGRVDIPPAEIDGLLQASAGTALLGRYLAIGNHARNGADDQARAEAAAAKEAFENLQPAEKTAVAPLMDLIRFELALIDGDAATLRSIRLDKDFEFRAPYLSLRRQAFLAALEGDAGAAEQILARHEAFSENSIDAGARASERAWRERIRDLLRTRTTSRTGQVATCVEAAVG